MKREGERKTRSDKKIDVKPTVSVEFKRFVYRFAELCEEPVKDVAERLIVEGAVSKTVIDDICQWFRRDYYYKNTIALGHTDIPKLTITYAGETDKISIKFKQEDYDTLSDLAHALDVTPTTAAGILIKVTLRNVDFMNVYMETFLDHLSGEQFRKVEEFLKTFWGYQTRRAR